MTDIIMILFLDKFLGKLKLKYNKKNWDRDKYYIKANSFEEYIYLDEVLILAPERTVSVNKFLAYISYLRQCERDKQTPVPFNKFYCKILWQNI